MKPLANGFFLTPLSDKFLQNTELFFVSWLATFRVMDGEVFVVRRHDSCFDIGCACFEMSDILHLVRLLIGNSDRRRYTAREVLNIALISDDFPTPDYYRIYEQHAGGTVNKPYATNDKDPEPVPRSVGSINR